MSKDRKRGRPKGTGINDQETLLKIAMLIAGNPNMKRTTAIKEAGITNPSVIRRLRDKYQEQEHALLAEVAISIEMQKRKVAGATVKGELGKTDGARKAKSAPAAGATSAAQAIIEDTISASTAGIAGPGTNGQSTSQTSQTSKPASTQIDPLAALFEGLSVETLVSQFIGHVLGIEAKEINGSPITALIRQQAQLVDLVLPMLMAQFANQKHAAKAA